MQATHCHAHPADRQRLLRAAARRLDAQQPGLARPPGAGGHACRIVCGPAGEGAELRAPTNPFCVPARGRSGAARAGAAAADPRFPARLGAGLLGGPRATPCCGRRTTRRPGRVVYLAHTPAVLSVRSGKLEPGPRTRRNWWRARRASWPSGSTWRSTSSGALGREAAVIHPPIYGGGSVSRTGEFRARA